MTQGPSEDTSHFICQETSQFAKKCKKDGGFFKCCVAFKSIDTFEDTRNKLIEEGLIKDKTTHHCKKGYDQDDPCRVCTADGACTTKDPTTGQTKQTFITEYKKEHKVSCSIELDICCLGWRL